ncbi:MAG: DnaJ domain-containing protein [Dehalococcoidia bacterium]|nr:DnaJ domain-containing protein [Dehalococcoidia bacterium]
MARNLYEVLGIKRDASEKEVRSAYRRLARKFHPDVAPNDKAAESRFKEVNAAFEVLSDSDKRAKYDKYGDRWEHADQIEEAQRKQSASGWARQQGAFGGQGGEGYADLDFGSVFGSIFGRDRGSADIRRRGADVETPVEATLEEAFRGTSRTISIAARDPSAPPRRLEVRIPPGVKTGSRVRVAGEGHPGSGGAPAGDLFLLITVLPHSRFERKGDDLVVDVVVPLLDAVLGGEVEVPTIDGRVMLKLPELTQNGKQFRLGGKGMPVLSASGSRGDLYARVKVQLPEQLAPGEREHFEALRALRAGAPAGRA